MTDVMSETGLALADAGVVAVGHRVVHGGRNFSDPVLVDERVLAEIKRLGTLAPLHNPANATGIEAAQRILPDHAHVAVFDTGFFATLPPAAYTYAIDAALAKEHALRRYGFHGTSHEYVSARVPELLGADPASLKQIVCHLGNGASMSAIDGGRAVETSMGVTPLEGFNLLGNTATSLYTVAFVDNWHWWGFLVVIFLTAMRDVDPSIYEASRLDGANAWQEFRYITIPSIQTTITFMLLMTVIWSFMSFDYVFILTGGGPAGSSDVVSTFIYREAFKNRSAGYAAAASMSLAFISLFIGACFMLVRRIRKDKS